MNSRSFTLVGDATERCTGSFAGILVCAGLLNALIAAFLLCRLPPSSSPSLMGVFFRASLYVCGVAAAGAGGTWFYWRRSSGSSRLNFPVSLGSFCMACVAGWVWVPAVVLLVSERSPVAVAIAAVAGSFLSVGLRKTVPMAEDPLPVHWSDVVSGRELFADSLQTPVPRLQGYAIAISIYAAGLALYDRSINIASVLLGVGAFIFVWEWASPFDSRSRGAQNRRVTLRFARIAASAVLVTVWAMLDGVAHRGRIDASEVTFAA